MIREESRLGCAPGSDCCSECAGSAEPEMSAPITPATYIGIGLGLLIFFEAVAKKGNR